MNYIKWKIEELKKYVSSTPKIEPTIPVRLEVEKITSDTYAGETLYEDEQFILLDIYPKTNGAVSITYGGLTKTITDTSEADSPNAQKVFFGTFNGVSDNVETPLSGELIIEGDYRGFGASSFPASSKAIVNTYYTGFKNIYSLGNPLIIPTCAFYNSTSLASIEIPNSVTSIGSDAFRGTSLTSIEIPNSVTKIVGNTFMSCTSLTNVVIPDSVTSIGNGVFNGCTSLTSIEIPNSVTSIGSSAFSGCTSLTNVTFANTSGWYVTETDGATSGTAVDVSDSANNVTLLTDTYKTYYWYRS